MGGLGGGALGGGAKTGLGLGGLGQTALGGGGATVGGLGSSISQPSLGNMPASMPVTKPVLPLQQHQGTQLQQQQQPATQFVLGKPPAGRKRNA